MKTNHRYFRTTMRGCFQVIQGAYLPNGPWEDLEVVKLEELRRQKQEDRQVRMIARSLMVVSFIVCVLCVIAAEVCFQRELYTNLWFFAGGSALFAMIVVCTGFYLNVPDQGD